MQTLSIGKLAAQAGIGVETVRFYEREGLIAEPPRRESGYREYPPETVARLLFIKRSKELGFTLGEIKELLALKVDPSTTSQEIRSRAHAKIADIEGRIDSLERMRQALMTITASCHGHGPATDCPILEALDSETPLTVSAPNHKPTQSKPKEKKS